jgi:uncharacterized protein (DUF2267 family)
MLQTLRDRLPVDLAAHLGAQMPLLVRGPYYDPFEPSRLPSQVGSAEDFTGRVSTLLADSRASAPKRHAVFGVTSRHLSEGQLERVGHTLPPGITALWPEMAA